MLCRPITAHMPAAPSSVRGESGEEGAVSGEGRAGQEGAESRARVCCAGRTVVDGVLCQPRAGGDLARHEHHFEEALVCRPELAL